MKPATFTPRATALMLLCLAIAMPLRVTAASRARDGGAVAPARTDSTVASVRPAPALLLDAGDLGFGATVVFTRIPSPAEIHDLQYLESVTRVLLQLPAWPEDAEAIVPLEQVALPEGADLVVVLPGYPGMRAQAAAWNLLRRPVRIIMVVNGPPVDRDMVFTLNSIRGLERVIADLQRPSRTGFERLQRPLSFRVVEP